MTLQIYKTPREIYAAVQELRSTGKRVGFVPTMGALHDGHVALGTAARQKCAAVIYSIFVNPKQFAPNEDFSRYPRTLDADLARLEAAGVAGVYLPSVAAMYPDDFLTSVHVAGVSEPLEGEFRPGFFDGVATVVAKLLLQVLPDAAYFGEKDYQQLLVVKRLAADLDLPVDIIGLPTVRDANGLALSSRNAYLTPAQYKIATRLNVILKQLAATGDETAAHAALLAAGFARVDYCAVRDAATLQAAAAGRPARALAAAWLGTTRLIDNVPALTCAS